MEILKNRITLNDSLSDYSILTMILEGKFSRNRQFEFFSTERGRNIMRKAKLLQGVISDIRNGAKVISEAKDKEGMKVTLENDRDKYTRTIIMNPVMYDAFNVFKNS